MSSTVKVIVLVIFSCIIFKKANAEFFEDINGCIGNICYHDPTFPIGTIQNSWKNSPKELKDTLGNPVRTNNSSRLENSTSRSSCRLCETKTSIKVEVISIIDNNNLKLYVLNTNKYPRPMIHMEVCKLQDSECALENLPNDMMTRCVQKMTTINLLTFNVRSKEFLSRTVTYPSACDCVLLEVIDD
nr:spaetzle-2 protein [Altica viridicyanea]